MGTSYRAQVAVAFEILAEGLAPVRRRPDDGDVPRRRTGSWWRPRKLGKRRDVIVSLSDPHFQLEVLNRWWGPAFSPPLTERRAPDRHRAAHRPQLLGPSRRGPPLRPRVRLGGDPPRRGAAAGHRLARRPARMADLQDQLQWEAVQEMAREQGMTESEAMLHQLTQLREEHDELEQQLPGGPRGGPVGQRSHPGRDPPAGRAADPVRGGGRPARPVPRAAAPARGGADQARVGARGHHHGARAARRGHEAPSRPSRSQSYALNDQLNDARRNLPRRRPARHRGRAAAGSG